MKCRFVGMALFVAAMFVACDEDTGSLGIYDESDAISSIPTIFEYTTRSLPLDSVVATSTKSYLGQVYDPETGISVRAEFLSQFHTFENYRLPDTTLIVSKEGDSIVCDSVFLRLYFTNYVGDATNPMKVAVYELDTANVVREDSVYYSTIKLESFKNPLRTEPLAEKVFTASDYTLTEADRTSTTRYDNVRIALPKEYGTQLFRAIAKHPEYMVDSYQFIRHICPGFFFNLKSGIGTMLTIDVSTLDIYFSYLSGGKSVVGLTRFSGTQEVIQSTRIMNNGIEAKAPVDPVDGQPLPPTIDTTFIVSPAGIATELTIPVDKIYQGHESDSISRARVILNRYNSKGNSVFGTPSTLLLVRKSQRFSFFEKGLLADNVSSFVTDFNSSNNTYTFSNIGQLISLMYHEKQSQMHREGLSSEQYNAAYPDWNRLVVIPVATTTNTSGTLLSVIPDYSLSSALLVGGTTPLQMQVIYSTKL